MTEGVSGDKITDIANSFSMQPELFKNYTPGELKEKLEAAGGTVLPLGRGHLKDVPFEEGGGFRVNFGDGGLLQYHPASKSHHGGAYFKISTGKGGIQRYDLDGNKI